MQRIAFIANEEIKIFSNTWVCGMLTLLMNCGEGLGEKKDG